jgi:hypothetical protein
MPDDSRTENFKNNLFLDDLIHELKQLLEPIQQKKQEEFTAPKWPVGIIVGNPRSGSTLLLQWIASLNQFSYPSNVLTRFAYSPYIGALIQKMLFDPKFDYHDDFKDIRSGINFQSDLGKSRGALATNEFQHFFRCYLPNKEIFAEYLDENALGNVDISGLRKGLASIEYALEKPFFTKGTFIQFNIDYFYENIPELFFVMIRRDPLQIMQSLVLSRENYYGSREKWFSVKPFEYQSLVNQDIYHQIAGQVYFTDKAILHGLKTVPEGRKIIIDYEDFCKSPKELYELIIDKYANLGYSISIPYSGPDSFISNNQLKLPKKEIEKLESAYDTFRNTDIKTGERK